MANFLLVTPAKNFRVFWRRIIPKASSICAGDPDFSPVARLRQIAWRLTHSTAPKSFDSVSEAGLAYLP